MLILHEGQIRENLVLWAEDSKARPEPPSARPPHLRPPEVEEFWSNPRAALQAKDLAGPAIVPNEDAALIQQSGRFPLWQGSREFVPAMQAIYHAAS